VTSLLSFSISYSDSESFKDGNIKEGFVRSITPNIELKMLTTSNLDSFSFKYMYENNDVMIGEA
jgi:hypothetical protein